MINQLHPMFFHFCIVASIILLGAAIVLSFSRIVKGPSLPDRVVALDNISMNILCIIAVFTIISEHPLYLDIIIALALISFLGMVAFAQFIEYQLGNKTKEYPGDF